MSSDASISISPLLLDTYVFAKVVDIINLLFSLTSCSQKEVGQVYHFLTESFKVEIEEGRKLQEVAVEVRDT